MKNHTVAIGDKIIGDEKPTFLVAEISQAHDGSLGMAHSYIDAVAAAGADAIKFQTHIAAAESTEGEPFRVNFSYQDETRFDYWKRMEFTNKQWQELADHATSDGLIFLSSPFSVDAVELLESVGVPAWKVGSGEVNNPYTLDAMIATRKPILISTGMSDWLEIDEALNYILSRGSPAIVLQCTSKYPTQLVDVGLNVLNQMRERYGIPVGLSDHSGTTYPALAAMAIGINLVELHVVFDKAMFGPDTIASITLDELKTIVAARNAFQTMFTNPVDKDMMSRDLHEMKNLFNKSVALRNSLDAGAILTHEELTVKKPGTGIPSRDLELCIGRHLKHAVPSSRVLKWSDLADL